MAFTMCICMLRALSRLYIVSDRCLFSMKKTLIGYLWTPGALVFLFASTGLVLKKLKKTYCLPLD